MIIDFTEEGLDMDYGNLSTSLTINETLQISALVGIGLSSEEPSDGIIYLEKNDGGLGVRTLNGGSSKYLSSDGVNGDQALVFDFSEAVIGKSILVGLNNYDHIQDDPVIRLSLSDGGELSFGNSHANWSDAVSSAGSGKIVVDMSLLLGTDFSGSVDGFTVTETTGHVYVNSLAYSSLTSVPEPATAAILSFGGILLLSRRKRK